MIIDSAEADLRYWLLIKRFEEGAGIGEIAREEAGYSMLDTRYSMLDTRYWILEACEWERFWHFRHSPPPLFAQVIALIFPKKRKFS